MSRKFARRNGIMPLVLLAFLLLLLQRSNAQNQGLPGRQNNDAVPNYSIQISLPPVASEGDALTLPELPIYDKENRYLQVRDSSQDWYDANLLNQEHFSKEAIYSTFAQNEQAQLEPPVATPSSNISSERENRASVLLDAEQRILADLQDSEILLDETLMPIPR